MTARVLVVGSFNLDHVWTTARLPEPGATRSGHYASGPGGKGFNQAIAAVRAARPPASSARWARTPPPALRARWPRRTNSCWKSNPCRRSPRAPPRCWSMQPAAT
ncbi:hypothetical protein [Alkalisalibacterium limincola]|uniref:hypothetical protein n=1 Tax=Alkalisalibacterium limincola TaxID=2699169 RepID=UPI0021070B85|nr:hypothetical protein [Alkalisalibacterium limincola]